MAQKKVLLLGSYGQTNLGDDLLMWNYLTFLQEWGFTNVYVNANVASNIPQAIREAFPNLKVIVTYNTKLMDWVRLLRTVDYVVYGGGTVYKELYGSTGRGKYSVIARIMVINVLARLLGARVYHLHIGIGVLKTWLGRTITRLALGGSKTIFRDAESYAFARDKLGLPARAICQATDGLFLVTRRWQNPWRAAPLKLADNGRYKRVVGVNALSDIPDWIDREAYLVAMRTFINDLIRDNTLVVLLPFQHAFNQNNDADFMRREILPHIDKPQHCKLVGQVPIDQLVAYFKKFDAFVGMRFHSLLIATVTGTPYVGIAYDTKCSRFMNESKYPYHVPLKNMQAADLQNVYAMLLGDLPKVPTMLSAITEVHQQKGKLCLDSLEF